MTYKDQLGGVIGLSGMNALNLDWSTVDIELKNKTPVFLYHGASDSMISHKLAEMTYDEMKVQGLQFTY